ncbi:tRNA (guanosine(46)-N7)-methyltransferase TrmB [Dehalobacterium formicoaceticum]|uniref:tRNA (guanosine(46)-N7)-methyltransferase TrmB n=1 Tax=Dehalobacterium formicoaceticum TaxID=51515 RepID=UPI000B7F30D4|nr:tRNA (guanosine(46)-N7)-methyltransferase TrmB [Dehalobacterium formicoaceticum]
MRLRRIPGTKEALTRYPDLVVFEPARYYGCWKTYFGQEHPIYLELGMGKGKFISTMAGENPQINFIGMEFREEMVYKAIGKAGESRSNMRFLWAEADDVEEYFAPGEIQRIYLNFSDPWPKKRHGKRRLTHQKFLKKYKHILSPGGEIHFKTDNQELFEFSLNEFAGEGFFLKNITFDLHRSQYPGNITTEYEERYRQERPIYRCEAALIDHSQI